MSLADRTITLAYFARLTATLSRFLLSRNAIPRGTSSMEDAVIDTNVNSLSVALENVTASESAIRDADFAEETAKMTRAQILVQANTSILAQANSSPNSVLSLLRGG